MSGLELLTEGERIKEQLKENACWKYQEIYVKKVVPNESIRPGT